MLSTFLNSLIEINDTSWLVRGNGITFGNREVCPEIAQFNAMLNAAKIWCYQQLTPSVISILTPNGDAIQRFNDPALSLIGLSIDQAKSPPPFRSGDFWANQQDYWDYRQILKQTGKAEARIKLLSIDGRSIGELGIEAAMLSPDFPLFYSKAISH